MKERIIQFWKKKPAGQSLVEAALMFPILVLIMVGVIETSQLVLVQNRVSTAARSGARFGANGGEDVGILNVTLNTVTQTLPLEESEWDIWVIRGEVDDNRQIQPEDFTFTHVYGLGQTTLYTETNSITFTNELRLEIETTLMMDEDGGSDANSAGLRFVGVYNLHRLNSILGLDIVPSLAGYDTIRSYSVMRRQALSTSIDQSGGCKGVFPMGLEFGVRTITEPEYNAIVGQFTYPTGVNIPEWRDFPNQPPTGYTASLLEGREGYIYKFDFGTQARGFQWLKWNTNISGINGGGNILATALHWPGTSNDYMDHGDPPDPPNPGFGAYTFRGFAEAGDPDDRLFHNGDHVVIDTVSGGFGGFGVQNELNGHIDAKRVLRMMMWDISAPTNLGTLRADNFAAMRIRGYSASNNWLLLELYRLDDSCGQLVGGGPGG